MVPTERGQGHLLRREKRYLLRGPWSLLRPGLLLVLSIFSQKSLEWAHQCTFIQLRNHKKNHLAWITWHGIFRQSFNVCISIHINVLGRRVVLPFFFTNPSFSHSSVGVNSAPQKKWMARVKVETTVNVNVRSNLHIQEWCKIYQNCVAPNFWFVSRWSVYIFMFQWILNVFIFLLSSMHNHFCQALCQSLNSGEYLEHEKSLSVEISKLSELKETSEVG